MLLVIAIYIATFWIGLLQINTVLYDYFPDNFLYKVMAQHFGISFVYGYYWLKLTRVPNKYHYVSALLLPIVYFMVVFVSSLFSEKPQQDIGIVVGLLAVSQFAGISAGVLFQAILGNHADMSASD